MRRIRSHLTYANVMSTIAVFLVLGGGTALAAYVVSSNSQIGPGTVSGHKPPTGKHANLIAGSINGQDVANNSLTGAKIVKFSGVDACTPGLLIKFGRICAGGDGVARNWNSALDFCSDLKLRVPTTSEAKTLASNYTVPGVSGSQLFWTDNEFYAGDYIAVAVQAGGAVTNELITAALKTVCVANPTN
jgi:hypothetical protein